MVCCCLFLAKRLSDEDLRYVVRSLGSTGSVCGPESEAPVLEPHMYMFKSFVMAWIVRESSWVMDVNIRFLLRC